MKLNRIVGLVVMAALTWTPITVCAEEREGVLTPRALIAARPIDCGLLSPIRGAEPFSRTPIRDVHAPVRAERQLVQIPAPGTRLHGIQPSLKALAWAGIGIATFMGIVALSVPHK